MDPVTLSLFAIGAKIASGYIGARASRQSAEMNAQTDEANAFTAELAAGDARNRGSIAEGRVRLQGGQVREAQGAAYASSGVDATTGSAADMQGNTAALTELDALTARNNAAREAWGYDTQASQLRRRAAVSRATGESQGNGQILGGYVGAAEYARPLLKVGS